MCKEDIGSHLQNYLVSYSIRQQSSFSHHETLKFNIVKLYVGGNIGTQSLLIRTPDFYPEDGGDMLLQNLVTTYKTIQPPNPLHSLIILDDHNPYFLHHENLQAHCKCWTDNHKYCLAYRLPT
jgi:hypothetical protein